MIQSDKPGRRRTGQHFADQLLRGRAGSSLVQTALVMAKAEDEAVARAEVALRAKLGLRGRRND